MPPNSLNSMKLLKVKFLWINELKEGRESEIHIIEKRKPRMEIKKDSVQNWKINWLFLAPIVFLRPTSFKRLE